MNDEERALFVDLYELTMYQAYDRAGMNSLAVFELFIREMNHRNFFVVCGIADALEHLERLRFSEDSVEYLRGLQRFEEPFLNSLKDFQFTGDVYAVREGEVVFPDEPILQVCAPVGQAQMVETYLLNQVLLQTALATKAERVARSARGRRVVDFGMRRMHGTDAALKAARAFRVAGIEATSNVLAGKLYGLDVAGTMAHSFVQAHDTEARAFRDFAKTYPGTTLLVDTYDALEGVRLCVGLARDEGLQFGAIRLDTGTDAELIREARRILDEGDLGEVKILVSGGLDEYRIAEMLRDEAPVDGFGVGTRMGVSADEPYLDGAYKLCEYDRRGRMKVSADQEFKANYPGRKQIYRCYDGNGLASFDVIARAAEESADVRFDDGSSLPERFRPLLEVVMKGGKVLRRDRDHDIEEASAHREVCVMELPRSLHAMPESGERAPFPVKISEVLQGYTRDVRREILDAAGEE